MSWSGNSRYYLLGMLGLLVAGPLVWYLGLLVPLTSSPVEVRFAYPAPYSLVSADVPIKVSANRPGCYVVTLQYGEGVEPHQWTLITQNNLTINKAQASRNQAVEVASWHTGLTNYRHGPDYPKLVDFYTLKMTVRSSAWVTEDTRILQVGNEVPNITGGVIFSKDRICTLRVPSHGLLESFMVGGITKFEPLGLPKPDHKKQLTSIYEIKPTGLMLRKPAVLTFHIVAPSQDVAIGYYEVATGRWQFLPSYRDRDTVSTLLPGVPSGNFAFYGVFQGQGFFARSSLPGPQARHDVSGTANYILLSEQPVMLTSDLKLMMQYRLLPEHKLGLYFRCGDKWFELNLGDDSHFDWELNARIPGWVQRLPDSPLIRNGTWQSLVYPLGSVIARCTDAARIDEIELANWDSLSYMDWKPGKPFEHTYYFRQIRLQRDSRLAASVPTPDYLWRIGFPDRDNGEFSHEKEAGDHYQVGTSFKRFERAIAKNDPVTNIHFDLIEKDVSDLKPLQLLISVAYWDQTNPVSFAVDVNGGLAANYKVPESGTVLFTTLRGLRAGKNSINLRWTGGGQWITWDYLQLAHTDTTSKPKSGGWIIGQPDDRPDEFAPELNAGDDYEVGASLKQFEKAISRDDQVTRIHFYIKEIKPKTLLLNTAYGDFKDYRRTDFTACYSIRLNGHLLKIINAPADSTRLTLHILPQMLIPGENILTLTWLSGTGGGEYINWDFIRLKDI